MTASIAPVSFSVRIAARPRHRRYSLSRKSRSRPSPTREYPVAQGMRHIVEQQRRASLPSMSPRRTISDKCRWQHRSTDSAASESLRESNTPTTIQALRCFSGLPAFYAKFQAHSPAASE